VIRGLEGGEEPAAKDSKMPAARSKEEERRRSKHLATELERVRSVCQILEDGANSHLGGIFHSRVNPTLLFFIRTGMGPL
jgi:hypothetical protein